MYEVVKYSESRNDYDSYVINSFDIKKDALICKIENNWEFMAKYKNYKYNEDFQFNWSKNVLVIPEKKYVSYVIPISNDILITYDVEKLERVSKNQSKYFKKGSSVCYIREYEEDKEEDKDKEDDDEEYKTCKICERGESIYNITGCCGICIDCAQDYTCRCKV